MKLSNIIEKEYPYLSEKKIDKNLYEETEPVKKLRDVFEEYLLFFTRKSIFSTEEYIRIQQEKLSSIPFNQKDITTFSILLTAYTNHPHLEEAGIFLSRLLHIHTKRKETYEEPYLFIFEDIPPLSNIGWKIKNQHLIVTGSVGDNVGAESTDAHIDIHGNTGNFLGSYSTNATIIIQGNTEQFCGIEMAKSYVRVHGNAGSQAGTRMRNGYLIIDGKSDYGVGQEMFGGIIIAKGECSGIVGEYMRGGLIILEKGTPENSQKITRYNGKIVFDEK